MKALFLLLTVLGVIAVKFVTGKNGSDTSIVVSNKQQPAIAGKIAFRRRGKLFTTTSLLPNYKAFRNSN